jgi:hypothetical protein
MASLVSKVTAMSKLALDMTRLCIEINGTCAAHQFSFGLICALCCRQAPRCRPGPGGGCARLCGS